MPILYITEAVGMLMHLSICWHTNDSWQVVGKKVGVSLFWAELAAKTWSKPHTNSLPTLANWVVRWHAKPQI